jgi:hypothetical protein
MGPVDSWSGLEAVKGVQVGLRATWFSVAVAVAVAGEPE